MMDDWYDIWNNEDDYVAPSPAPGWQVPMEIGATPPDLSGWYHIGNPPPAGSAPPGTTWMLNPSTQSFESIQNGQMPPWGAHAAPPGSKPQVQPGTGGDGGADPWTSGGGSPIAAMTGGGGGWQVPNAPMFSAPRYRSPGKFAWDKPAPFQAPGKDAIYEDPGFVTRLEHGQKAIENAASATGTSRTGATWKGLIDYAERMASQEYGNVYQRRAGEYDRTYRNAFEDAVTSYGFLVDDAQRQFTNDLAATSAEYAPSLETWRAQNDVDMFGENLDLSRLGLASRIIEAILNAGRPTYPG